VKFIEANYRFYAKPIGIVVAIIAQGGSGKKSFDNYELAGDDAQFRREIWLPNGAK
jgi:hypothetical protein